MTVESLAMRTVKLLADQVKNVIKIKQLQLSLHNVYSFSLSLKPGGTYCTTSQQSYDLTYICPNSLGREEC